MRFLICRQKLEPHLLIRLGILRPFVQTFLHASGIGRKSSLNLVVISKKRPGLCLRVGNTAGLPGLCGLLLHLLRHEFLPSSLLLLNLVQLILIVPVPFPHLPEFLKITVIKVDVPVFNHQHAVNRLFKKGNVMTDDDCNSPKAPDHPGQLPDAFCVKI